MARVRRKHQRLRSNAPIESAPESPLSRVLLSLPGHLRLSHSVTQGISARDRSPATANAYWPSTITWRQRCTVGVRSRPVIPNPIELVAVQWTQCTSEPNRRRRSGGAGRHSVRSLRVHLRSLARGSLRPLRYSGHVSRGFEAVREAWEINRRLMVGPARGAFFKERRNALLRIGGK